MITLLSTVYAYNVLEDVVLPIFICVVLPCVIVWLCLNSRKHELDKKTEIALKAIENGSEIDPKFLSSVKSRSKGIKEKVFGYLKAGIILSTIGIFFLVMGLIMRELIEDAFVAFYSTAAIFILLGGAYFVIYVIAKNKFSNEIVKEEAEAKLPE